MKRLLPMLYLIPAAIHLLPVAGVLGSAHLARLYGLEIADPTLEILMRHRAVLFAVVGGLLLVAAWRADWRTPALLAGLVSVVPFLVLAFAVGGYGAPLQRVIGADVVALVCLVAAAWLHFRPGQTAAATP